ncbi:MAG TPA: biotin/lipoyl-binding protein, partial [Burkholderiaceae bacterium]
MRLFPTSPVSLGRLTASAAIAVLLLAACGKKDNAAAGPGAGPGGKMPPPEVGVVITTSQPVALQTELPARAEPVRVAQVRARVNGVVLKRLFTEGSLVKQGQSLYQIDPAPYQAQVSSAQAALGRAQANLTQATA